MGRTNNEEITNPAIRFFEWSGSEGKIKYYDKEKKENVLIELPFAFLALERLATVTGFSDDDDSGIWSNEVMSLKNELLTVRTRKGIKGTGFYNELKGINGLKFAQSLYIAFYDEQKVLQIGNFKIHGSALGEWIEFAKKVNIYKGVIRVTGATAAKKGKTEYFTPQFTHSESVTESAEIRACDLHRVVLEYLNSYFARSRRLETNPSSVATTVSQTQSAAAYAGAGVTGNGTSLNGSPASQPNSQFQNDEEFEIDGSFPENEEFDESNIIDTDIPF